VQAEPDGFYIIDQRSTNGTFVNDRPVQRQLLRSGDIIRLGGQGPQIHVMIEGGMLAQQYGATFTAVQPSNINKQPHQQQPPTWEQPPVILHREFGQARCLQTFRKRECRPWAEAQTAMWKDEAKPGTGVCASR